MTTLGFRGEALPSIAAAGARAAGHAPGERCRPRSRSRRTAPGRAPAGPAGRAAGHDASRCATSSPTTPARRKFLRTHAHRGRARGRPAHAPRGRVPGDRLPPRARRPRGGRASRRCATCASAWRRCSGASARGARCRLRGGRRRARADRASSARRASRSPRAAGLDVRQPRPRPGEPSARRWVRDRLLLRAVLDGYESLLMRGRYPVAMLFLATRARARSTSTCIPAKLEVRFRRPQAVHQLIVAGAARRG